MNSEQLFFDHIRLKGELLTKDLALISLLGTCDLELVKRITRRKAMAQMTRDLAESILRGDGITRWEIEQLCHFYLKHSEQPQTQAEPEDEGPCQDDDGCPREMAVLKRFWREHQAQAEPVAGGEE